MNERSTRFFKLVRDFLAIYLPDQRAVSINTIKSYRECLNQLLNYICDKNGIGLGKLSFEYLSRETVESYLEHLEKDRHCSVSTRNHRLACIRSFVKYAGFRDVGIQAYVNELNCIPLKKAAKTDIIKFFSESALKTILEQPDVKRRQELRNLFFMILMYDTGARNQELLDLKLSDINPEVPESLHCHMFRHSRSMHLYRSGMPMVLLAQWLGHAQLSSTQIYANADTQMKRAAIEKATSKLNPLVDGKSEYLEWVDDEALIRQLYGLSQ